MDNIVALLTTREGRIGRQQWWIGMIVLSVVAFAASTLLFMLAQGAHSVLIWGTTLLNLALIWPAFCLGIKRRHDRDNKGIDLWFLFGGSLLINLVRFAGVSFDMVDGSGGVDYRTSSFWLGLAGIGFLLFSIYMFVQLGFLKGTAGPNRYGLDPLDGAA